MSIELTLDLLLGLSVIGSLVSARITSRLVEVLKDEFGAGAAIYVWLSSHVMTALWVVLAVQTDRWQFAALALIPWLVRKAADLGGKA